MQIIISALVLCVRASVVRVKTLWGYPLSWSPVLPFVPLFPLNRIN